MDNKVINEDISFFARHFPFLQEISGSTILVTGATGLLGSMIVRCLVKLNEMYDSRIHIVAIARDSHKITAMNTGKRIDWICKDVKDMTLADLRNVKADFIFHCASPTTSDFFTRCPVETINTIFQGTQALLCYASLVNTVKGVLYVSSIESYGAIGKDGKEVTERDSGYIDPANTRSSYSLGKKMAECLCYSYAEEYGVPVKIARLTQTFGAGVSLQDSRVFAQFAKSIINEEDIILHTKGESSKSYCYTIDAILAFFYILLKGKRGEIYNVANTSSYMSVYELAQFLSNNFNPHCRIRVDEQGKTSYAPSTRLRLSTEKLESLGWKPYFQLHEMFSRLIAYYRNEMEKNE